MERLREWVAVLTGQSTDPAHPIKSVEIPGGSLYLFTVEAEVHSLPTSPNLMVIRNVELGDESSTALTIATLMRACELATGDQRPPVEYLLLSSAKTALLRDEYRRAVIDAGTAAEIALSKLFAADLGVLDSAFEQAILGEQRTLGRLVGLMGRYRDLPADLNKSLVALRNSAVHKSTEPTREAAAKAIGLATELVAIGTPPA